MERHTSHLFAPYKALGDVCSDIPPVFRTLQAQKKIVSILCAIDNVVVQYTVEHLRLVSISDPMPSKISCIAADKRFVYVGVAKNVAVLHLSRQIDRWLKIGEEVKYIVPFGEVIVVIDQLSTIHVIDIDSEESLIKIDSPESFIVTAVVHPFTYINKILLGSKNGYLRLINVNSGKLIYEFRKNYKSEVTVLEQSPALDVIGVGLSNGKIILLNIKLDKEIMSFTHDAPISSLCFRTDGTETLISSTTHGLLAVWDLNLRKIVGQKAEAHLSCITKIHCLHGEPILVSAGTDNQLKSWIFDMGDEMPRQLVVLEGHAKPVCALKFLQNDCVLSASRDGSIRLFSIKRDTHRQKLGNAGIMSRWKAKKLKRSLESIQLNPIIEMAVCHTREAAWDNLLCRHDETALVTTWTTRRQTFGKHRLLHKRFLHTASLQSAIASAICITSCGNFAVIGYSTGHIDCFNIQSGIHRKSFSYKDCDEKAHSSSVRGLTTDELNHNLISGDEVGNVRFWNFNSCKLICEFKVPSPITHFRLNGNNSLLAIGIGTGAVGVVDILCRRVVRVINEAHKGEITAIEFSPDGKWLLSAAKDSFLKVWDLMANSLIDVMKFTSYCNGISFSSSGQYMSTSHVDQRSVFLWANKALFSSFQTYKSLPLDYNPSAALGLTENRIGKEVEITNEDEMDLDTQEGDTSEPPFQENSMVDLICLSGLAYPRWANLPNLHLIKERNKPIEPPRKPKAAPFFLPSIPTLVGFKFEKQDCGNEKEREKIIKSRRNMLEMDSPFVEFLIKSVSEDDFIRCFETLMWMSISSIDIEIRGLPYKAFAPFMRMLLLLIRKRRDFELVQSYLATFLSVHYASLWKYEKEENDLSPLLMELLNEEKRSGSQIEELLSNNKAIIQYIKSAVT